MFSLIITIISIALVVALAIASIYYGGAAFTQGNTRAVAATVVSQAQQIAGGATLSFNQTQTVPASVAALQTSGYLTSVPNVPAAANATTAWTISATEVGHVITSDAVCNAIDASAKGTSPATFAGNPPAAKVTTQQYGCFGTTGAATFYYAY